MKRSQSFLRRVLTGVLAAAMILTASPSYAFATETGDDNVAETVLFTEDAAEPAEAEAEPAAAPISGETSEDGGDELLTDHSDYCITCDNAGKYDLSISDVNDSNIFEDEFDNFYIIDASQSVKIKVVPKSGCKIGESTTVSATMGSSAVKCEFARETGVVTLSHDGGFNDSVRLSVTGLEENKYSVEFCVNDDEENAWDANISRIKFCDVNGRELDDQPTLTANGTSCMKTEISSRDYSHFSITPAEGVKIVSVTVEYEEEVGGKVFEYSEYSRPVGDLYWIDFVADTKITINTTKRKTVKFDKEFGWKYSVKTEYEIEGNSQEKVLDNIGVSVFTFPVETVKFTVIPRGDYSVFGVYEGAPQPGDTRIDSNGVFTLDDSKDYTITVESNARVSVSDSIECVSNIYESGLFSMVVSGTKDLSSDVFYNSMTNDTAITLKMKKDMTGTGNVVDVNGYDFTAYVKYGGTEETIHGVGNVITIPLELVKKAQLCGFDIEADCITAEKKKVKISANPDNLATLRLWSGDIENPGDYPAIGTDTGSAKEYEYYNNGEALYVYSEPAAYYSVTGVNAGTTKLAKETKKAGGKDITVYKLPYTLLKQDLVLNAVTTPLKMTEPNQTLSAAKEGEGFKITKVDKDTRGTGDTWALSRNIQNVGITLETSGKYILTKDSFKLLAKDDGGDFTAEVSDVRFTLSAPALNKTKNGLVYTLTAPATGLMGRKLEVTADEVNRKLKVVTPELDKDSVLVRQNGMAVEGKSENGYIIYPKDGDSLDPFATYVISALPGKDYALTGKADVNGKSVSAPKGVVSVTNALCDSEGKTAVSFDTQGVFVMRVATDVNGERWDIYPNNSVMNDLPTDKSLGIFLSVGGEGLDVKDTGVSVTSNPKDAFDQGFAKVVDLAGIKIVKIDPGMINDTGKSNNTIYTVTVTGTDPANPKKSYKSTVNFTFRQEISSVSVTGPGVTDAGITQDAGTEVAYPLTLNANADITRLKAEVVTDDDAYEKNASAWIDAAQKKLYVRTYSISEDYQSTWTILPDTGESKKNIKINLYEGDPDKDFSDKELVKDFEVITSAATFDEPSITVKNVSARHFTVAVTPPKNLGSYENAFYEVKATLSQGETAVYNMREESETYRVPLGDARALGVSIELLSTAATDTVGAKKKYDISARLIQTKEVERIYGYDHYLSTDKLTVAGKEKILKEQSTKDVNAYESRLTLSKKTTSFIQGQKNVLVGVVAFSKNTSYTWINGDEDKTYLADQNGNKVATCYNGLSFGPDGLSIYIDDTSNIPVGKARLYVTPALPGATHFTPATIDLTVKAPINHLTIEPSGNATDKKIQLFKQDGNAATLKFVPTAMYYDGEKYYKPASSALSWRITEYGEGIDESLVEINAKNGILTVNRNYVLSSDPSKNWVKVQAFANDHAENDLSSNEVTVFVTNQAIKLSRAAVLKKGDNAGEFTTDDLAKGIDILDLNGAKLTFYDASNAATPMGDLSNLSVMVSPATGLSVDKITGVITATKAGRFTVTATANDGGKSTIRYTINCLGLQFNKTKPFEMIEYYYPDNNNLNTVSSRTVSDLTNVDTTTLYACESVDEFAPEILFYDSAGNEIDGSDLNITVPKDLTYKWKFKQSTLRNTFSILGIKKAGKYKITAKPKDGSKAKIDVELTFKSQSPEKYKINTARLGGGDGDPDSYDLTIVPDDEDASERYTINAKNNAGIIELYASRTDSAFDYNTKTAKLTAVSGGKITAVTPSNEKGMAKCMYAIKPLAETVELKFSDGSKIIPYTITNTGYNARNAGGALKLNKNCQAEFIGGSSVEYNNVFTFDLPAGLQLDDEGTYRLVFRSNEAYLKLKTDKAVSAYQYMIFCLNEAGKTVSNGTGTVSTAACDLRIADPGTYRIDVNLVKVTGAENSETVTPVTKPVTIAFKSKVPLKINAKLASAKVSVNGLPDETPVLLKLSNGNFWKIKEGSVKLYNNNYNGAISVFTDCFKTGDGTVYVGDDKKTLKLTPDYAGVNSVITEKELQSGSKSVTGWIEYTLIGEDGVTEETRCEMITATITLPSIVWLGDSLTQGGLGEENGNIANAPYNKLKQLMQADGETTPVEGYGYWGYNTKEIFAAYQSKNKVSPGKTYILWVGSVDWVDPKPNTNTAPVIRQIDAFLARNGGVKDYIIIGTTSRWKLREGELYRAINNDLEKHYGDHYLDVIDLIEANGYSPDKTHLSQESYDAIAEKVYEKLEALGYI